MKQLSDRLEVVILAAGQGTRMASRLPKVLHELAGRPLLRHVLDSVAELAARRVHVVVGHRGDQVRAAIADDLVWVEQGAPLGTGHAVAQALPGMGEDALVLVVYGDVPLIGADTLRHCVAAADGGLALVTAELDDPAQLGRIVRDPATNAIRGIVEFADADDPQRAVREINSGIMAGSRAILGPLLERLGTDNAQGEQYLTDVVALAVAEGLPVAGLTVPDPVEVRGVNTRAELAELERLYQRRVLAGLMAGGVTAADPARVDIRGRVSAGQDCFLDVNVVLEGDVVLGDGVHVGPGVVIRNSVIAEGARIEPHSVVDGAEVGAHCQVGPFARVRPGTRLGERVKIGNFVEVKNATLGPDSKASHLTYLGDATLGADCNVGAGTVTCNYDGIDKHRTTVGDRVFVGTNTTLVAPVDIGSDAFVAAGSTITSQVEAEALAVARSRQRNIHGWVRPDRRKRED